MKLKKINAHKRDDRISFDENPHIYYVDGKPYDISVTGFIKTFFEEFNADIVVEKNYEKWQANQYSQYYGLSMQEIKDLWRNNADNASNLGSILHRDIELFQNDVKVDNNSNEFRFFLNFQKRIKGKLTPYRTEWMIFDEETQLAGSIDMCYTDNKNQIMLFDWKRSKKITKENNFRHGKFPINHLPDANYWHYALQLNIYKYILEKNYNKLISGMNIVKLHPNQEDYKILAIPNLEDEVLLMIKQRKFRN